jgi:hypothetical protein
MLLIPPYWFVRYSYDAVQFNQRIKTMVDSTGKANLKQVAGSDLISSKYGGGFNRGRVKPEAMVEVGFEDCDYVSLEEYWQAWSKITAIWPLELHVPCRDPLEHLMSQCNHRGIEFECDGDAEAQVRECLIMIGRFNATGLSQMPNMTLKCFNPIPIYPYIDYMDQFLQRKRIETQYVHRSSSELARNKAIECIWKNEDVANRVSKILQSYDYYGWCEACMGGANDLLAP